MFVDDWYNYMYTMWYLICLDCNNSFRMKNFWSNDAILGILSINLDVSIYLSHCVACDFTPPVWKYKYHFPIMGVIYILND